MNLILMDISVVFLWFGLASAITEVLSRGGGGLLPEGKKIAVSMSISLIALAASASLPLRSLYFTISCRLSICSSALTCAFLLSPFLPSKLFWVPYIACVFTPLHLLGPSDPPQRSLQQIWSDTWQEICGAASSGYNATVRSVKALLQSSRAATSNGAPETSTSPCSSSPATAAALSIAEGNPHISIDMTKLMKDVDAQLKAGCTEHVANEFQI